MYWRPQALGHVLHLGGDLLDDLGQKRAGAGGGIENLHAMHRLAEGAGLAFLVGLAGIPVDSDPGGIGQAIGQAKLGLQHLIHRPHDEVDHGFGRIPHPPRLALGRVVGGEEGFIEMQERVVLAGQLAEPSSNWATFAA
jgi:hypothetical protein